MFGLFDFRIPTPAEIKRRKEALEARLTTAVDWDPTAPWVQHLTIKASSYHPRNLFPEVQPSECRHWDATEEQRAVSPGGTWLYVNKTLPRGSVLDTALGSRRGTVVFDGPVVIPCLFKRNVSGKWDREPWMSMTPLEYFTLRAGTRQAKGHTIIAGLGLGHQLIEVSQRKSVKQITLIDNSAELVEWILPRVLPFCAVKPATLVVEDAKTALARIEADVALVDIWDSYGGNSLYTPVAAKKVWCWGAA